MVRRGAIAVNVLCVSVLCVGAIQNRIVSRFALSPALMQTSPMPSTLVIAVSLCLLIAAVALVWRHRAQRRHRALVHLVDRAEAMEQVLLRTRERMQAMRAVVDQVPEDIGQLAQASLHADQPIRDALRDVLEHRLWIQKQGASASQHELDTACAAIDRAYQRLSGELQALESASAALAAATVPALESARREPPALRRGGAP